MRQGTSACRKPQSSIRGIEREIVTQNSSEFQRREDRFAVPDVGTKAAVGQIRFTNSDRVTLLR